MKSLQQMDFDQKITWKRGQLSLRDSFSYLPGRQLRRIVRFVGFAGDRVAGQHRLWLFSGGSCSGNAGTGAAHSEREPGGHFRESHAEVGDHGRPADTPSPIFTEPTTDGHFFHWQFADFGSSGLQPHPDSHTQIALVYGYQGFDFSVLGTGISFPRDPGTVRAPDFRADGFAARGWTAVHLDRHAECSLQRSERSSPYVDCILAGDTLIPTTVKNTKIGVAAQARLRYQFPKATLESDLSAFRNQRVRIVCGSAERHRASECRRARCRGCGAHSSTSGIRATAACSRLSRAQLSAVRTCQPILAMPLCPANECEHLHLRLHRRRSCTARLGRDFHGYASYQFNELSFDHSYCGAAARATAFRTEVW